MKGVIVIPAAPTTEWARELFPGSSPAELPLAGRRAIDYVIEESAAKGFDIVEILDYAPSYALEASFSDPSLLTISVFYVRGEGEVPNSLEDLRKVSSPLTQSLDTSEITLMWGLEIGGKKLDSIKAWHEANFEILSKPNRYTLPSYSSKDGVNLGCNVAIERGSRISPPALVCDNAWLARHVQLEGNVIIGSGAFVGEGVKLKNTVVFPGTYVGDGLVLEDKIVAGSRIIDPKSLAWTDVEDPGVARMIEGTKTNIFKSIWRFFAGRSHEGFK